MAGFRSPQDVLPALGPGPAILFVTATRIGDAVLSTGLLRRLEESYPGARFTVVAGPAAAPLFTALPGLEKLIALTKRARSLHWLDLYQQVALRRWDLVVDLRGSGLAWLLLTRYRRVMAKGRPDEHRILQLARLFAAAPPPSPYLWLSAEHERRAVSLLPAGGPILAIGPTANWGGKQWRAERFAELAARLTAPGAILSRARIAVFAAPTERALAAPVLDALAAASPIDLIDAGDLLTVATCLKRCALFIGNDTGLMHMAAAAGTPTLGLFGPSPTEQYAPWGDSCAMATTDIPYRQLVTAADFDYRSQATLMDSLSVDKAEQAAIALLRRLGVEAA